MDNETFRQFQKLIYEKSGITLNDGKEALVSARVGKRLRELALSDYRDYLKHIQQDQNGEEIIHLLDAISTNVTQFFREPDHFDFLESILGKWAQADQLKFRIWSAASSTGQEPYSIAMSASSALQSRRADLRILATDLCTRVLKTGKAGSYPKDELKGIPKRFQTAAYLTTREESFEISDSIKRLVTFARLNLSAPPFPMHGPFDVVFCRNVMIYFDRNVRDRLVREIFRLLRPGGYLLVGHSETLTGLDIPLSPVRPSVYVKEGE